MTGVQDHPAVLRTPQHISVSRIGGAIGAVIGGLRISGGLSAAAVAELHAALLAHKIVFLRDQQHTTDADQRAFAALLGPLTRPHPTVAGDATAVLATDSGQGKANSWHTIVTYVDRVPAISALRAIMLPPYGGTTVRANTAAAYQRLHPALHALAGGLRAVHTNLYDYPADRPQLGGVDVKQEEEYRAEFRHLEFGTEHPVVRVHPETGEPALLLGHFVRSFTGLSPADPAALFALLQRHITRLENTVRWTWRDGDIAIRDNRATQHYAVAHYGDLPRLHRVTVAGDIPVGINRDTSVVRKGDASHYSQLAA